MKNFIVTGSSSGIGKEIAKNIAKQGNKVILAVRSEEKGKTAIQEIIENGVPKENLDLMIVDLSSQKSIKQFANNFKNKYDKLHCLVNNAGISNDSKELSEDEIEFTFATNTMGYFLMGNLLTDILIKSAPSRIVNVASNYAGDLDLNDINYNKRKYDNNSAYRQSKQANRMYSWALAEKLKNKGVTVNCCHPGVISTQLLQSLGFGGGASTSQGAETPAWLATSPEVEGQTNKFWDQKKEKKCNFRDEKQLNSLWEKMVNLTIHEIKERNEFPFK